MYADEKMRKIYIAEIKYTESLYWLKTANHCKCLQRSLEIKEHSYQTQKNHVLYCTENNNENMNNIRQ